MIVLLFGTLILWATAPVPAIGSNDDLDGDHVDDTLEAELCGDRWTRQLIIDIEAGRCLSETDLEPPISTAIYTLWSVSSESKDADGDGFPATVSFTFEEITLHRAPAYDVERRTLVTEPVPIDLDDSDGASPIDTTVCVPVPAIGGVGSSVDEDGDGLPRTVHHSSTEACYDRRQHKVDVNPSPRVSLSIPDEDDEDPDVPGGTGPWTRVHIVRAWPGPDLDRDGAPSYVTYDQGILRFETGGPVSPSISYHQGAATWDRDDADANVPVPYVPLDSDADEIPDGVEHRLCFLETSATRLDGRCTGALNYVAPCWWPRTPDDRLLGQQIRSTVGYILLSDILLGTCA